MGMNTHKKDIMFQKGFDVAIDLVMSVFDNSDIHTLPIVLREEIQEEVERYKIYE